MKKGRDRLVLVAAVVDHERCDPHQVGDIGDLRPLPHLISVQIPCERQRAVESWTEPRRRSQPSGRFAHPPEMERDSTEVAHGGDRALGELRAV